MKIPKNTMVLGKDRYYDLDIYKTHLNNNVMIVGSPGSGKTRGIVIPNSLQARGSYVVSDPKGNLCDQYGPYLESKGYDVKRLDFVDPLRSVHYNPLAYARSNQEILKLATVLATTTSYGDYNHADPVWPNTAIILLSALIAYTKENLVKREQTLRSVFEMLSMANASANEIDSGKYGELDMLFKQAEERQYRYGENDSFAVRQYKKIKTCSGRTYRSIVISALAGIGQLDTDEVNYMTEYDEIKMCEIGKKKTALFVVVSDTDRSMDTLSNIFYMQLLNELCLYADEECVDNHLPIPVRLILDDFATNCKINDFPRMIASFRSRWISAMLIIQAESQLKAAYGDEGSTIIDNCDSYVYLGGNDLETARGVSEKCDEPLLEVFDMPVGESIIRRRGEASVHTKRFPLEKMDQYQMAVKIYKDRRNNSIPEKMAMDEYREYVRPIQLKSIRDREESERKEQYEQEETHGCLTSMPMDEIRNQLDERIESTASTPVTKPTKDIAAMFERVKSITGEGREHAENDEEAMPERVDGMLSQAEINRLLGVWEDDDE